jgi:GTP-binding protein
MFVDRVQIRVEGGRGGDGCVSFRRERYVPRGGPDGGDGGDGGSIHVVARTGVDSLSALAHQKTWKAENGQHGSGDNRHGRSGGDLEIRVPPGTLIRDAEAGYIVKDLVQTGERVCVARGGKGGKGNTRFKSATNRTPRESTRGEQGEQRLLEFELKLVADVGLVGMPNAGKSTLLSRLSRARPLIADYPFTTKSPHLGIVEVSCDQSFVMADIPGLIANAHLGAGMGLTFLRHVDRTRLLVHLVEPEPSDGSDPLGNYRTVRGELEQYSPDLAARSEIVTVSKADLPAAEPARRRLEESLGREVLAISAVTGEGLDRLVGSIAQLLWG